MTRLRRATLFAFGACLPLSWLLAGSSAMAVPFVHPAVVTPVAVDQPKTIEVGDTAEGWYLSVSLPVDLCTTPVGCPQVPVTLPSIYAPDTLHVGVVLGTEVARSYVQPDLHALPYGAHILKANMTLPVDLAAADATLLPQSAHVVACLATDPFEDGAAGAPLKSLPKVDCRTSSTLTYDAKHGVFTVDITKFLDAWGNGAANYGIALIPDAAKTAVTDLWHVTMNGHRHAVAHIKTSITYTPTVSTVPDVGATETPAPGTSEVAPAPPVTFPDEGAAPVVPPAPVIAPTTAQPVALVTHFKYPMAFLFPIALLAVGVFLTRLFTRDATPVMRG